MQVLWVLTALVGLVLSQSLDLSAIAAVSTPSVQGPPATATQQLPAYDTKAAVVKAAHAIAKHPIKSHTQHRRLIRRDGTCSTYAPGAAPTTSPDTADAFLENPVYSQIALNATTPSGYVQAFSNLDAAVAQNGYLGLLTFTSYDTLGCQRSCDAATSCTAFNMYIERNPTVDAGTACPNPSSSAYYRCTLWGLNVTSATATNSGQYRGPADANGTRFEVVVRASNGYNKNLAPPSYTNFTGPVALGGAIVAPASAAASYIGVHIFAGVFDPAQCATVCQATTAYDKAHLVDSKTGRYDACNFFNAFVLSNNSVPVGTYCSLYTRPWSSKRATNVGQYDAAGNYYSVSSSYAYTLAMPDLGFMSVNASSASSSSSSPTSSSSSTTFSSSSSTPSSSTTSSSSSPSSTSSSYNSTMPATTGNGTAAASATGTASNGTAFGAAGNSTLGSSRRDIAMWMAEHRRKVA